MTFEEEKQDIIKELIDFIEPCFVGDAQELIAKIKELQPDKPKCSTCKYLINYQNLDYDKTGNTNFLRCEHADLPFDNEHYIYTEPENFGCIYHEEKFWMSFDYKYHEEKTDESK